MLFFTTTTFLFQWEWHHNLQLVFLPSLCPTSKLRKDGTPTSGCCLSCVERKTVDRTIQRDGVGTEWSGLRDTCAVTDACLCIEKPSQYSKVIIIQLKLIIKKFFLKRKTIKLFFFFWFNFIAKAGVRWIWNKVSIPNGRFFSFSPFICLYPKRKFKLSTFIIQIDVRLRLLGKYLAAVKIQLIL